VRRLAKPANGLRQLGGGTGGQLPDVLDDSTTPAPDLYGAQKVIRIPRRRLDAQGMLDGRSLRRPRSWCVRQGQPRGLVLCERNHPQPLAGVAAECPVPDTTGVWILSPKRVVEAFMHAHELPASAWPSSRVVNLPGITLSVREMIDAMGRVAGKESVERVKFVSDARIQGIVKTWPVRFKTERALAMGFKADTDFDSVVRDYLDAEL
jgi:nucleoside-diphosphate-sugar epimerase